MIKNRNINKIKLNGSVEIKRINKFIWKNCTCGGGTTTSRSSAS